MSIASDDEIIGIILVEEAINSASDCDNIEGGDCHLVLHANDISHDTSSCSEFSASSVGDESSSRGCLNIPVDEIRVPMGIDFMGLDSESDPSPVSILVPYNSCKYIETDATDLDDRNVLSYLNFKAAKYCHE